MSVSASKRDGINGLLPDKTRKPGKPPLSLETIAKVLALSCGEVPGKATRRSGRVAAKATGGSVRAVQRIWKGHNRQPNRE